MGSAVKYLALARDIALIVWHAVFPVEQPRAIITDKGFGRAKAQCHGAVPMAKEEGVKKKGKGKPGC